MLEVVASVAVRLDGEGTPLGFITNGSLAGGGSGMLPIGRDSIPAILEVLARLEQKPIGALGDCLAKCGPLPWGTTIIYFAHRLGRWTMPQTPMAIILQEPGKARRRAWLSLWLRSKEGAADEGESGPCHRGRGDGACLAVCPGRFLFQPPHAPALSPRGAVLHLALGFFLARLAKGRGWRVIYVLLLNLGSLGLVTFSLISRLGLMRPAGGAGAARPGSGRLLVFPLLAGGESPCPARVFPSGPLLPVRCGDRCLHRVFLAWPWDRTAPGGRLSFGVFLLFLQHLGPSLGPGSRGGRREYLLGYRGIGLVLSFVALVLFLGPGLLFLLFPYLTKAAAAAYGMMRGAAAPFAADPGQDPALYLPLRGEPPEERLSCRRHQGRSSPLPRLAGGWRCLSASWDGVFWRWPPRRAWSCWPGGSGKLIRWLSSSTEVGGEPLDIGQYLRSLWLALREHLQKMLQRPRYLSPIAELYARLLAWGRRRGLPPLPGETPREYGRRLSGYFPELDGDITQIVERFNEETYGGLALPEEELAMARRAWRRLSNPSLDCLLNENEEGAAAGYASTPLREASIQSSSSSARRALVRHSRLRIPADHAVVAGEHFLEDIPIDAHAL